MTGNPSSEPAALADFLAFLEAEGIPYCILGDSTGLPGCIESSDIDVAIARDRFPTIVGTVSAFCRRRGIRIVRKQIHEETALHLVLSWCDDRDEVCFLHLDFCTDFVRNGRRFLKAEELLAGRIRTRGFYVPASATEFTYYFIKRIDKLVISVKAGQHLTDQYERAPEAALRRIKRIWPDHVDEIAAAALSGNWADLALAIPVLRARLHAHFPRTFMATTRVLAYRAWQYLGR